MLSSTLLAGPTGSTADLYNHLTTQGALIGQIKFTDDDTGKQLSNIDLNDLGLRDLNYDIAHGVANFAIGGAVTTPDAASPSDPFPPSPIDPPPPLALLLLCPGLVSFSPSACWASSPLPRREPGHGHSFLRA